MANLWSGRTKDDVDVHLTSIRVRGTYDGLLLGTPNAEYNRQIIHQALKDAQSMVLAAPVLVLEPNRTNVGRHERLPPFECQGHFRSYTTKTQASDGSSLTIVWFQVPSPLMQGPQLPLDQIEWWENAFEFDD